MDLDNVKTWREIKLKDIIVIKDFQAMEEGLEKGLGAGGIDYTVVELENFKVHGSTIEYMFVKLSNEVMEQSIFLVVKIVDNEFDLRIYYELDDFNPGTRKESLEGEFCWLFEDDVDEDFSLTEIPYANEIIEEGENEEGESWRFVYSKKPQEELIATVTGPFVPGQETLLVTIVEYLCTDGDTLDTELLILERGTVSQYREDEDVDGGVISLYKGSDLNLSDIDIFAM
jgi:hypothetical protein